MATMDKVLLKEILDTISGELHPRLRSACLLEGGVLSVCVCVLRMAAFVGYCCSAAVETLAVLPIVTKRC